MRGSFSKLSPQSIFCGIPCCFSELATASLFLLGLAGSGPTIPAAIAQSESEGKPTELCGGPVLIEVGDPCFHIP